MKKTARSEGLWVGLEILDLFMDYTESLGITEISHRKNLPKSRVHRAVKTMAESGYLRQDPETRRYSLGFRAFKLGIAAARQFGAFPEIRMLLKRLSLETKGSVSIRIADHNEMVIVEAIDSTDILRIHSPVGGRRPWDFGAGGKVAAAHRPQKEIGELIKRSGIGQYTKFAVTNPARFMKELEKVRRQGYAVSEEEHVLGSFSAAAPLLDWSGGLFAVLVVAMPAAGLTKYNRSRVVERLVQTAEAISLLLQSRNGGLPGRPRKEGARAAKAGVRNGRNTGGSHDPH